MGISGQALGLGSREANKLQNLLANANDTRRKQLERAMQRAVDAAIKEPNLTAANVNQKIAAQLRNEIPEITQP